MHNSLQHVYVLGSGRSTDHLALSYQQVSGYDMSFKEVYYRYINEGVGLATIFPLPTVGGWQCSSSKYPL